MSTLPVLIATQTSPEDASTISNKFPRLSNSKAYVALRSLAHQDKKDFRSLRLLLILINAHPKLTAHYRIFENLKVILDTPPVKKVLESNPEWQSQISIWKELCNWVVSNKSQFAQHEELKDFDYDDPIAKSGKTPPHPLNRNFSGFTRNGICSSIFTRHESVANYCPAPASDTVAHKYLCLQAHLLIAYVQCRNVPSQFRQMLRHTGEDEWPKTPISSYSVSISVRQLNHQRYSEFILGIPDEATSEEFNQYLSLAKVPASITAGLTEDEAEKEIEQVSLYLTYLQKYFSTVERYLAGLYRKRNRGTNSGSKSPRFHGTKTGYIHFGSGVWLQEPTRDFEDEDIPRDPTRQVLTSDFEDDSKCEEAERSGLAPDDARTPTLKLYDPDEMRGAMMRAKFAEVAKRMAAQKFAWDYEVLTSTELRRLWKLINETIRGLHVVDGKINAATYNRTQSALILKIILLLGQDLETVRNLRISNDGSTDFEGLAFHPPRDGKPGWWQLPSIQPEYLSSIPSNRKRHGRAKSSHIELPDIGGIGNDVLSFLAVMKRTFERVFSPEKKTAKQGTENLIKLLAESWLTPQAGGKQGNRRITLAKIRNAVGIRLQLRSGDATIAWIASADNNHRNETRLHYTNLSSQQIAVAYIDAVCWLLKDIGEPMDLPSVHTPSSNKFHGARFVASMDSVKQLVANLSGELSKRPSRTNPVDVINYHNNFTFHVWLLQSLCTSIRAINNPDALVSSHQKRPRSRYVGLSDKENQKLGDKARLISIPELLKNQLYEYSHHMQKVKRKSFINYYPRIAKAGLSSELFYLDGKGNPLPITSTWVEEKMNSLGIPLPSNFHRAFLRTELISRGSPGQVVDAFLGHANQGESPFFTYSTLDYQRVEGELFKSLLPLIEETGITLQRSAMVSN